MMLRTLCRDGPTVSGIGLGCKNFAGTYASGVDPASAVSLIREAADAGVTLFDTAETYGPFTNEALVALALEPVRDRVTIATKFGFDIDLETGERKGGTNSRPEHIRAVADAALKRLRTDRIDLFYQHRVDPAVPIEDMAGAVSKLIAAGKVTRGGHTLGL